MKLTNYVCKFFLILAFAFPNIIFAQSITLYDQPTADAKKIGDADLSAGIIPIFKSTTGDWVKIADPKNGNVGWVKASDVNQAKNISVTQKIVTDGQAPQSAQMFPFGLPPNVTPEQAQAIMKRAQEQQQKVQVKFQNIMKDMGNLFQEQMNTFNNGLSGSKPATPTPVTNPQTK